jgi:hypothetical protein
MSAHAKLNRQTREAERPVTLGKQITAACSNSQIFQKRDVRIPQPPGGCSRQQSAFLPGSAQYVENDVTHSKQTPEQFLPGSRIARMATPSSASPRAEACDGKM